MTEVIKPQDEPLINLKAYPVASVLKYLLQDKTTKGNIIWATDTYTAYGKEFRDKEEITENNLLAYPEIIRPRIKKSQEEQSDRTRKRAEVFTPVWLCNEMNNYCDEDWFGRPNVFNVEKEDHTWEVVEEKISFPEGKSWQSYVDSRRLEISCGEAPFLVSRYDVSTGELIEPLKKRIGILDRKIRVVNENTNDFDNWLEWVKRAFKATYGYEFQGDNLLVARINLLLTFTEYYEERWNRKPSEKELLDLTRIITWNLWQMDGLNDKIPLGSKKEYVEPNLFESLWNTGPKTDEPERIAEDCKIRNWRSNKTITFHSLRREL